MDQETRDFVMEKECRAVYQTALYAILHNAPSTLSDEDAIRRATNIALASIGAFKVVREAIHRRGPIG